MQPDVPLTAQMVRALEPATRFMPPRERLARSFRDVQIDAYTLSDAVGCRYNRGRTNSPMPFEWTPLAARRGVALAALAVLERHPHLTPAEAVKRGVANLIGRAQTDPSGMPVWLSNASRPARVATAAEATEIVTTLCGMLPWPPPGRVEVDVRYRWPHPVRPVVLVGRGITVEALLAERRERAAEDKATNEAAKAAGMTPKQYRKATQAPAKSLKRRLDAYAKNPPLD